jgi:hypothetical protein
MEPQWNPLFRGALRGIPRGKHGAESMEHRAWSMEWIVRGEE